MTDKIQGEFRGYRVSGLHTAPGPCHSFLSLMSSGRHRQVCKNSAPARAKVVVATGGGGGGCSFHQTSLTPSQAALHVEGAADYKSHFTAFLRGWGPGAGTEGKAEV